jgi:hypothetical protein
MSTAREKLYLCTFTYGSRRISTRLRAWDEEQAAMAFREELQEQGIKARGVITVNDASRGPERSVQLHAVAGHA